MISQLIEEACSHVHAIVAELELRKVSHLLVIFLYAANAELK